MVPCVAAVLGVHCLFLMILESPNDFPLFHGPQTMIRGVFAPDQFGPSFQLTDDNDR